MAQRESVAGAIASRTDEWRFLADELGDGAADLVCLWADHCRSPKEALSGALSVLRLSGPEQDRAELLNVHMMTLDVKAYMRAAREEYPDDLTLVGPA